MRNGSLITEPVARGMIEAGLDAINISVDASGKEVFEATRIGLKYDKVIANIERLLRLRWLSTVSCDAGSLLPPAGIQSAAPPLPSISCAKSRMCGSPSIAADRTTAPAPSPENTKSNR